MRTIKTLLSLAATLLCFSVHAQKTLFSHSAGAGFYTGSSDYTAVGLVYSPRINFAVLSERAAFSIGTHLGMGANFRYTIGSNAHSSGSNLFADLPLVVEYNFGNAATRVASTRFGGFIGTGYCWHFTSRKDIYDVYESDNTVSKGLNLSGPVINAGFRFPIGHASFGLRFAFMFNTGGDSIDSYDYGNGIDGIGSVGLVYNIGTRIGK